LVIDQQKTIDNARQEINQLQEDIKKTNQNQIELEQKINNTDSKNTVFVQETSTGFSVSDIIKNSGKYIVTVICQTKQDILMDRE